MKIISHLVAVSHDYVIGVDNDLPWSLKDDLAHFKKYTLNKVIIMGCKTYESIGRPLPNRINYVISRTIKDCLLYTSPSPRDGLLSRMPSSA